MFRNKHQVFLVVLTLLLGVCFRPASLFAGDTARYLVKIRGIVLNQRNDTTLNYARVVSIKGTDTVYNKISDDNGEFEYDIFAPGRYVLVFSLPGFLPKKISLVAEGIPRGKQLLIPMSVGLYRDNERIQLEWIHQVYGTLVYDPASGKFTNAILANHLEYMESLPVVLLDVDHSVSTDCFVENTGYESFVVEQLHPDNAQIVLPMIRVIESLGKNFTAFSIRINEFGELCEYKKIVYDWGGVFYKRNGSDISDNTFMLKINALKASGQLERAVYERLKK
jgi:hypothetical protein